MIDREQFDAAPCRRLPLAQADALFHTRSGYQDAAALCAACPIRQACLDFALSVEGGAHKSNRFGVYGGLTPAERATLAKQRREVSA